MFFWSYAIYNALQFSKGIFILWNQIVNQGNMAGCYRDNRAQEAHSIGLRRGEWSFLTKLKYCEK